MFGPLLARAPTGIVIAGFLGVLVGYVAVALGGVNLFGLGAVILWPVIIPLSWRVTLEPRPLAVRLSTFALAFSAAWLFILVPYHSRCLAPACESESWGWDIVVAAVTLGVVALPAVVCWAIRLRRSHG